VLAASRGDEALELAEQHSGPIDLLISDIVMPGMSGRELVRRLSLTRPDLSVLFTSGYTAHTITRHGVLESKLDFLQKPFTIDALARKVRETLDARRGSHALYPGGGRRLAATAGATVVPALSPKQWCDRILASLTRRMAQGPSVSYLNMVLTYFMEMDPTGDAFSDLLAEARADPRPRMADAARLLQEAWEHGYGGGAAEPPTLQEMLRTLGGLIDESGARGAYVGATRGRAQLQVFGETWRLDLEGLELSQHVAARTVLRGQGPAADPTATDRFETRLRLIGAELDALPPQWFELVATPRLIVVEGSAGHYQECSLKEIATGLARAVHLRQSHDRALRSNEPG
jgi:CheY-like chemotaxis protein